MDQYPEAKHALDRIELSSDDIPYGSKISNILNNYHFPSSSDVFSYFKVYLPQVGHPSSAADINHCLRRTINALPDELSKDETLVHRAFKRVCDQLKTQIEQNSKDGIATVNFVVGPTGSGKSAFSKSLFTVCLQDFWCVRIVPTRVEYTKYDMRHGHGILSDQSFFSFVRWCQFRDLMNYLFLSGEFDSFSITKIIADLRVSSASKMQLLMIANRTRELLFDGESVSLDSEIRGFFLRAIKSISNDDKDTILYDLASRFGLRFLISFDGFDTTRIEHFLFHADIPPPIYYIVRLVKGLHEKTLITDLHKHYLDLHYIVYLRDTTFERLRTEIRRDVGGEIDYLKYWVVPPKYSQLVSNVAQYVTRSFDSREKLDEVLSNDIASAFDQAVFTETGISAADQLSFIFNANARRMKGHIKQTLISSLFRLSQTEGVDFEKLAGGVDPKSVWIELVNAHSVSHLPRYMVLEDLYLSDARQLLPKLELESQVVTHLLNSNKIDEAVHQIVDADETTAAFGCVFNYILECFVSSRKNKQPGIFILIRIMQFIEKNPRSVFEEVFTFLRNLGYGVSKSAVKFLLYVLLRTELVKWDNSRGNRSIEGIPLLLSTTGRVSIKRLIKSITYVSEGIICSLHVDRQICKNLRDRDVDNAVWIADCVNNASIALLLLRYTEDIEIESAIKSRMVGWEEYMLYEQVAAALEAEAALIFARPRPKTSARWKENCDGLKRLRGQHKKLKILWEDKDGVI